MRTVFMGTPWYVLPVLETLLSLDVEIVGVYTQPDKPSGRGRVTAPPAVKNVALDHGIGVFQPASLRRDEAQRRLAALRPDVVVVAAYGKILPPEVLATPALGCVNVHPSLLPRYRGPSPVATAILEGEAETGTSLMLMDEGMDTGPVLASRTSQVSPRDSTTASLTPLLFELGADLMKEVLPRWLAGGVTPQPQDDGLASLTRKLEKSDGEASWSLPAQELERRLRAFTPWPGLFTHWRGKLLKVLSASVLVSEVGEEPGEPGMVVRLEHQTSPIGVVTGQGVLGLNRLQMEGKSPVTSGEFVSGYREFVGSKLPS